MSTISMWVSAGIGAYLCATGGPLEGSTPSPVPTTQAAQIESSAPAPEAARGGSSAPGRELRAPDASRSELPEQASGSHPTRGASAAEADAERAVSPPDRDAAANSDPAPGPLARWLTRDLPTSARFLDHGVIHLAAAAGAPHLYRLEFGIGLLDHLSLGVTARWLPEEARPRWSPQVALAIWRARVWEFGLRYAQVLHRKPPVDDDPETPDFESRTHQLFGTLTFAQQGFSLGVDAGAIHTRDLPLDPEAEPGSYRERFLPAGGLFLRWGTRRWGMTLQGQMPVYTIELALDLRFGAFELRPRGGWVPEGVARRSRKRR